MKNKIKLFGIIALVAVIGFGVAACSEGNNNSTLEGTWGNKKEGIKIVLNNGTITKSLDNVRALRGTYTASKKNITIEFTHISGAILEEEFEPNTSKILRLSASDWYTQEQLMTALMDKIGPPYTPAEARAMLDVYKVSNELGESAGTYTLSDNTLTITMDGELPITYNKQN
jgi:ABC-type glycerol-3-phosphate transport system substrate-binding protein